VTWDTAGSHLVPAFECDGSRRFRTQVRARWPGRLQVILCPEISGGGDRLFDETEPRSAWRLVNSEAADTGALCLTYERAR